MDWPEFLLHVVGCEEVQYGSKLQQEVILKSEDGCRSHNGSLREDVSGDNLSTSLALRKLALYFHSEMIVHTFVLKNSEGELTSAL